MADHSMDIRYYWSASSRYHPALQDLIGEILVLDLELAVKQVGIFQRVTPNQCCSSIPAKAFADKVNDETNLGRVL